MEHRCHARGVTVDCCDNCQLWRTFQTQGATSTGAGHQPPLGTMEFQWSLQHWVLLAPTDTATARRHLDCTPHGCTCPTSLTNVPSVPAISPHHGAGPCMQSVLWHKHLCPGTQVHLAFTGPQHRGPHHPGLAASPMAHQTRTPSPYPACERRAPPALLHSQAAVPLRSRAPHRPLQRPSFSSQALTRCGGETSPGPNLLPDLSSVLFSPHC